MVGVYERPRLLSVPTAPEKVDSEWVVAGVIVALAAIGITVAAGTVWAICSGCGTIGSVQDCYNSVITVLFGWGYC